MSRNDSYITLIALDQETYHKILDYLREADRSDILAVDSHIAATWGEEWVLWSSDLIADAEERIEYEAKHGLAINA